MHAKPLQSCPALCNPMDCSPPDSSVHRILQARTLEWDTMPSSRGSSWPRDWTHVSCASCIARQILYHQHHVESPSETQMYLMAEHQNTCIRKQQNWRKIVNSTIIEISIPLFTIIYNITRLNVDKESEDMNNTINQLDLIDICRILHPSVYFSSAQNYSPGQTKF